MIVKCAVRAIPDWNGTSLSKETWLGGPGGGGDWSERDLRMSVFGKKKVHGNNPNRL